MNRELGKRKQNQDLTLLSTSKRLDVSFSGARGLTGHDFYAKDERNHEWVQMKGPP